MELEGLPKMVPYWEQAPADGSRCSSCGREITGTRYRLHMQVSQADELKIRDLNKQLCETCYIAAIKYLKEGL